MASDPDDAPSPPATAAASGPAGPRSRLGLALLVLGLVAIVVGVLWILEAANGPGTGPKVFAQRRSYDQVKTAIHAALPVGAAISIGGLGLAMLGKRLMDRANSRGPRSEPDDGAAA